MNESTEQKELYINERKEVAGIMRRLYRQRLTTTSGGNVSMRVSDTIIVITPSATDKGRMKWKEVGILDIEGRNLTPALKPSIEHTLHLNIYRTNPKVKAIVHAHPVFSSAFTAMNSEIDTTLTAEARAICGVPVMVPYALMGTEELAAKTAAYSKKSRILLLENHGVIATGENLITAFDRLEVLENAARMTLITTITGKRKALTNEQLNELDLLFS